MQGQLLAYDFSSHPFAMARMGFYRACCASDQVPEGPMMFTGIDVLSLKPLPNSFLEHNVVMSYRWHPTQPYCSDFIFVKDKKSGFDFFSAVIQCMGWMPREIHHGPADQLALALVMGHIKAYEFDGNSHQAPFYEGGVLVPGDDFFFCPGDYFSSKFQSGSLGERKDDLHVNLDALLNESSRKYMLHFKGDRKPGFFRFADEYCSSFENDRLLA